MKHKIAILGVLAIALVGCTESDYYKPYKGYKKGDVVHHVSDNTPGVLVGCHVEDDYSICRVYLAKKSVAWYDYEIKELAK